MAGTTGLVWRPTSSSYVIRLPWRLMLGRATRAGLGGAGALAAELAGVAGLAGTALPDGRHEQRVGLADTVFDLAPAVWPLAAAIIWAVAHLFVPRLDFPLLWSPLLAIGFILARRQGGLRAGRQTDPLSARCGRRPGILSKFSLHPCPGRLMPAPGSSSWRPFTMAGFSAVATSSTRSRISALVCWRSCRSASRPWAIAHSTCSHWSRALPPASRGRSVSSRQAAGRSLWIAGGIGITPFLARLRAGPPTSPVHLVYLYRGEQVAADLAPTAAACPVR